MYNINVNIFFHGDRCKSPQGYDLKYIFAEKFGGKKLFFFAKTTANLLQKYNHNIGF
jgi:hypothetical protein